MRGWVGRPRHRKWDPKIGSNGTRGGLIGLSQAVSEREAAPGGGWEGGGKAKASKIGSKIGSQMGPKVSIFSGPRSDQIQTMAFIQFRSKMVVKMHPKTEPFGRCETLPKYYK